METVNPLNSWSIWWRVSSISWTSRAHKLSTIDISPRPALGVTGANIHITKVDNPV